MTGGPPPGGGGDGLTACARRALGERGKAAGPPSGPKAGEGVAKLGRGWAVRGGKGQAALGGSRPKGGKKREFPFSNFFLLSYYYSISNLLLSAYFMETKQIHPKGN
jgi:hypothetical protein